LSIWLSLVVAGVVDNFMPEEAVLAGLELAQVYLYPQEQLIQ